jgi:predicted nuclease with TOPRIM domain
MTKLSCFDPTTNYKAYSYCGTICKNYLIYKINQFTKNQKRNISYDNPVDTLQDTLSDSVRYSYNDYDSKQSFIEELTGNTVENIKRILNDKERLKINENEEKVGLALVNLMTNWDELFAQMGSNKFNKSSILLYLKETTMLNTKEIRDAMRIYKKKYYDIKWSLINE